MLDSSEYPLLDEDDVINFLIKANSFYNAFCYLQNVFNVVQQYCRCAQSPTLYQDNFIFIKLLVFNFFCPIISTRQCHGKMRKPLLTKGKQEITETT